MTQKFLSLVQSVEKLQEKVQDVQSDKYKWISLFLLGSIFSLLVLTLMIIQLTLIHRLKAPYAKITLP